MKVQIHIVLLLNFLNWNIYQTQMYADTYTHTHFHYPWTIPIKKDHKNYTNNNYHRRGT